jgi:hypothetical protein
MERVNLRISLDLFRITKINKAGLRNFMLTVAVHVKEKLNEEEVQGLVKRISDAMKESGFAFETQFFLYNEETMRIGVVPGRSAFMDRFPQA